MKFVSIKTITKIIFLGMLLMTNDINCSLFKFSNRNLNSNANTDTSTTTNTNASKNYDEVQTEKFLFIYKKDTDTTSIYNDNSSGTTQNPTQSADALNSGSIYQSVPNSAPPASSQPMNNILNDPNQKSKDEKLKIFTYKNILFTEDQMTIFESLNESDSVSNLNNYFYLYNRPLTVNIRPQTT
jgi:hypothetical protein